MRLLSQYIIIFMQTWVIFRIVLQYFFQKYLMLYCKYFYNINFYFKGIVVPLHFKTKFIFYLLEILNL